MVRQPYCVLKVALLAPMAAKQNLTITDLTGAGDLFAAGFLREYLDKSNIKKCLQTGSKLAAKIIQKTH